MMDAVKYFEIKKRMTKSCTIDCYKCGLFSFNNGYRLYCRTLEEEHPIKAVEIVEKWYQEHQEKTCAQVFFERFPDAPKDEFNGKSPKPCPSDCFKGVEQLCGNPCIECWNQKAPDEYQEWSN